jgi:hypothetical protein
MADSSDADKKNDYFVIYKSPPEYAGASKVFEAVRVDNRHDARALADIFSERPKITERLGEIDKRIRDIDKELDPRSFIGPTSRDQARLLRERKRLEQEKAKLEIWAHNLDAEFDRIKARDYKAYKISIPSESPLCKALASDPDMQKGYVISRSALRKINGATNEPRKPGLYDLSPQDRQNVLRAARQLVQKV